MATADLKSIDELFGMKFYIPSYQRGYRWSNVQVEELLGDLFDFAIKKEGDYYCLQPVIVKKRDDNSWELVDGQQRLTALWLLSSLYYCSNKGDQIGLEYEKFDLEYEGKQVFTDLFLLIEDLAKNKTMHELVENNDIISAKEKSIDSRNLIESVECIANYQRKYKEKNKYKTMGSKGVLSEIFKVISDIDVIWYVLDKDEDPIQTFTNINANKIELTNAELIKAILLNSCADENLMHNMALQWEDIEKGLNDNSFWNFVVNKKRNMYSTRIDYLFEIWCATRGKDIQNADDDKHALFRVVNSELADEAEEQAKNIWGQIQTIYDTLQDWYSEYEYYHEIGLLLIISDKEKDVDVINKLYKKYMNSNKKEFKRYILKEIRDKYFGNGKSYPFTLPDLKQIENDLGNINFSDNYVKNVLLLYNIALLVNANNTYERFPFELYKDKVWDIEHINPQTPKESSDGENEKKAWLDSYLGVLENGFDISDDPTIIQDIVNFNTNKLKDFESIAKRVNVLLKITENDSITNLVLLDSGTNRGYKNSCFVDKRKKIIEIERTTNNDEKYIPIGTKWVFLKGYENSRQLIVWGAIDMQDYAEDMAKSIYNMLGETK